MAGRPGLILLAAAVLAAHLALIDRMASALGQPSLLAQMPVPMFTRLLEQQAPPEARATAMSAAAQPRPPGLALTASLAPAAEPERAEPAPPESPANPPPAAQAPAEAASSPQAAASAAERTAADAGAAEPAVAQAPPPPALPPPAPPPVPIPFQGLVPVPGQPVAGTPLAQASAAARPASAPGGATERAGIAWAGGWPADSRLKYRLGGEFRGGPLFGEARVQWQRDAGRYQVRLEIDITPWISMVMTSQGEVTERGLLPRVYEEARGNRRRSARFGDTDMVLDDGRTVPKPAGVQDSVSQFVDLARRFALGQEVLETGRTVSFPLGRPGGADLWTYDIVGRETLSTERLGPIEAWRLRPRPIPNPRGNITAEMWFAPTLQFLPVRIRVDMGEGFVDLVVDTIEQR